MCCSRSERGLTAILALERYLRGVDESKPVAVILGRYSTGNFGAIQCLAAYRIPIVVADSRRQSSFYSRHVIGLRSPDLVRSEDNYIAFLCDLGRHLPAKGILFPIGDTELLVTMKHSNDLSPYFHFTSAPFSLIDALINKQSLSTLLERYHIPHPATYVVDAHSDLSSVSTAIAYPCILKPWYPTQFRLDFPTKGFQASTPAQFLTIMNTVAAKGHAMIAQEIIPGFADAMFGFNAYYDKVGAVHGVFNYQRIREWPLAFGNGCYIRQAHEPRLEQQATSLLKPLGYHGIVDIEFRRDPRDGEFKLIEINPRLWMQSSFPTRLGCNYAYVAYLDALGRPLPSMSPRTDPSARWLFGAEDILSVLAGLRQGTLTMKEWLSTYRTRNVYAMFSWDDPLPWMVAASRSLVSMHSLVVQNRARDANRAVRENPLRSPVEVKVSKKRV